MVIKYKCWFDVVTGGTVNQYKIAYNQRQKPTKLPTESESEADNDSLVHYQRRSLGDGSGRVFE